jgi:hypothetical protein
VARQNSDESQASLNVIHTSILHDLTPFHTADSVADAQTRCTNYGAIDPPVRRGVPVLYLFRNEIYGGRVALGHALLVNTQSLVFEEPIDLLDESEEFGRVLLGGGLLAEFEPSFFGVALHGAHLQTSGGLANLQNTIMDAAVRLSFFFPLRREKVSHCLLW